MLSSCSSQEDTDLVKDINKNGSIETVLNVIHFDAMDVLKTTHKVWVNGVIDKEISRTDTLKKLGGELKTILDENDQEKNIIAPKDYEMYITVK
jgi:hypothetical protein